MRSEAGDAAGALALYEESLAIRRRLATATPPSDVGPQLALVIVLYNVSTVAPPPQRRAALSEALAIAERLAQLGALPAERQDWPKMFRELLSSEPTQAK